jgi:outer membrane lipopolysaccharide assembly protein LptE/RlpB
VIHPLLPPGPRRTARAALALGIALAALLPGCGYTLKSAVPSYIHTLAVPVFQNNTVQFGLADQVTQALVNRFLGNGSLRIVSERDADAVLRGTITDYRNQVFGYTQQERATEYEVILTAQIVFRDQVKKRDLWKEDAFTVRTTYNVSPVGTSGEARTEADAQQEVANKLADQIMSRTIQGW